MFFFFSGCNRYVFYPFALQTPNRITIAGKHVHHSVIEKTMLKNSPRKLGKAMARAVFTVEEMRRTTVLQKKGRESTGLVLCDQAKYSAVTSRHFIRWTSSQTPMPGCIYLTFAVMLTSMEPGFTCLSGKKREGTAAGVQWSTKTLSVTHTGVCNL